MGRFLVIALFFVLVTGEFYGAYGITYAEALKQCQGKNSDYCKRVRASYLRKRRELKMRGAGVLEKNQRPQRVSPTPAVPTGTFPKASVQAEVSDDLQADRIERKSPFSLRYFSVASGFGKKKDDGGSETSLYAHLDWRYKTVWGWQAYVRMPMNFNFSPSANEDSVTMFDPYIGAQGTLWESGPWSFWSRLRLYLPLSEKSVDSGVTLGWGTDHSITYEGDGFSVYFQFQPRGKFYGFGSGDKERNNGSVSIELGLEGIALGGGEIGFYYSSGFDRKVGRDLGYLVFTDDSQTLSTVYGYKFNQYFKISPALSYNMSDSELGFELLFSGTLF